MRISTKGLVLALILQVALSPAAFSADPEPLPDLNPPEIEVSIDDVGHGWYLRGDVGYNAIVDSIPAQFRNFNSVGASYDTVSFDKYRFGRELSGAVGVGYKFNEWLRADITGDYFTSELSAVSSDGNPCSAAQPAGTSCLHNYSAGYTGIGILGNVYADLGTVVGVTPYVGGGIGAYNINWNYAMDRASCVSGAGACLATDAGQTAINNRESWRFAYDLAAGFSFEVSPKTMLDVGYRYTRIMGGDVARFSDADVAAGASGAKITEGDLSRHEIRAGIRILLW